MKSSAHAQSATSLPRAPRDEASSRSVRYLITMGIRVLCFALMALITPYGWYTWVFAAGAVFLPYVAVIFANVGSDVHETGVENPERALTAGTSRIDPAAGLAAAPAQAPSAPDPPASRTDSTVITLHETPRPAPPREPGA